MKPFVPADFVVPASLETDAFRLRMLAVADTEKDYEAVMESQQRLRAGATNGWPREGFTLAENRADLARHQQEFERREAFAYTVVTRDESRVLGCVYVNPSPAGARVRLWMRDSALNLEPALENAVADWLQQAWPFATFRVERWGGLE